MRVSLRFELILIAAAMNLCAAVTASAQDSTANPRALVQKLRASIVTIDGEDRNDQPVPTGLGFVIGRNLIATDDRVVSSAQRLRVKLTGQQNSTVAAGVPDSYRLASILTAMTAELKARPLVLGDSDKVAPDDRVYVFSDPEAGSEIVEVVVRRITQVYQKRYFELSSPLKAGIKGSPVFNSKGEVIGILGESPGAPHVSLAIPSNYLLTLLLARDFESDGPAGSRTAPATEARGAAGSGAAEGGKEKPPSSSAGSGSAGNAGAPKQSPHGDASLSLRSGTRPRPLNLARPQYTEEARSNRTKGVVRLRILVGADGEVKDARVIKGLPDGLNERAVTAVTQLKFKPGTSEGEPVASWLSVDVEFLLR